MLNITKYIRERFKGPAKVSKRAKPRERRNRLQIESLEVRDVPTIGGLLHAAVAAVEAHTTSVPAKRRRRECSDRQGGKRVRADRVHDAA
jgi:hypothetical protein